MFKNIGSKIKTLAKVLFWIASILSVVGGVLTILRVVLNAYMDTPQKIMSIVIGIGIIVFGILFAWIGNFLLYGFGELVDSNQKMLKILEERE